jgi:hypothetical protein
MDGAHVRIGAVTRTVLATSTHGNRVDLGSGAWQEEGKVGSGTDRLADKRAAARDGALAGSDALGIIAWFKLFFGTTI